MASPPCSSRPAPASAPRWAALLHVRAGVVLRVRVARRGARVPHAAAPPRTNARHKALGIAKPFFHG
jgi:hypothetical protein